MSAAVPTLAAPSMELEPARIAVPTEITLGRATEISKAVFLGEHLRNKPHNVLVAMQTAASLGVDPVAGIRHIHIFGEGDRVQAAISADLMVTLARWAGHIVQVQGTPTKATAKLIRGDSLIGRMLKGEYDSQGLAVAKETLEMAKEFGVDAKEIGVFESVWTIEMAQTAGLTKKNNWKNYPREMLVARAKASVIRLGASETTLGAPYTPDELGAETDADGVPLITSLGRSEQVSAPSRPRRESVTVTRAAAPAKAPASAPQPQAAPPQSEEAEESPLAAFVKAESARTIVGTTSSVLTSDLAAQEKAVRIEALYSELGRVGDAQKIAECIDLVMASPSLQDGAKKAAVVRTHQALSKSGRLDEKVEREEGATTLGAAIEGFMQTLAAPAS